MQFHIDEDQWTRWIERPRELIDFANQTVGQRKIRLFFCGSVRRIWGQLKDSRSRAAVEASELFADGLLTADELLEARKLGYSAWFEIASKALHSQADRAAAAAFMCANEELVYVCGVLGSAASASGDEVSEYEMQEGLLRDILGNSVDPTSISSSVLAWDDCAVPKLAKVIYERHDFGRLPLLGAALEAAGCRDADILSHCRGPGSHVRGCWVVDSVLEKLPLQLS